MQPTERQLVIAEFDNATYPSGEPTLSDAWLGIYQVLWWYEHGLLHIHDAPALWESRTWVAKASVAERMIAVRLGIAPGDVQTMVDRMMQLPRWQGRQRNNPLGHGFRMLVAEVLQRWGDDRFEYREEAKANEFFPGIEMPGRSAAPRIDVVAISKQRRTPKAVISCKWGIRHDRISDPTNECTQYKRASIQFQEMDLLYFVMTNEIDGQRLDKVLNQPCVDALVHVSLDFVSEVNAGLTDFMTAGKVAGRLLGLAELVRLTYTWH
jgi:hypothetical protein